MTRADFESIFPPKDNGKQNPDKSYTNEPKLFLDFLVRKLVLMTNLVSLVNLT